MNLFKKKATTCGCTGACETKGNTTVETTDETTKIIVLGACCGNSTETFENVKEAVKQLGLSVAVQNIGDFAVIASYGVMSTPALVVNGKVCVQGRKISVNEAVVFIEKEFAA